MTDQPQRSRRFHAGRRPPLWGLAALMAIALAAAAPAQAADFLVTTVADSGLGSLREAIEQANAMAEPSTIRFDVSGRIELESELPRIWGTLTIDGSGRSIVIDGQGAVRGFWVEPGATLTVRRLSITNGWSSRGAAIVNLGTLHLEYSTVTENVAPNDGRSNSQGGGIYSEGLATVRHSTISRNRATDGGAIANLGGTLHVEHSTIEGNRAPAGCEVFCGIGGGILNHGDATIGQSTISGNSAAEGGGGIFTGGGTLRVLDSTISGNTADDSGGGAMVFGTTVSVSNSTISRNNAAFGGGIWVGFRAEVTLIQSTISGNTAGEGGGIVNLQGAVNVSNTIIANSTGADCWNGVIRLEAGRADLFDPVPECLPGEFTRFVYSVDVSLACRSRDGNLLLIDFPARVRTSLGAARPGLQSNLLNVVFYRDREHNLWIGTDGDGLYRVRRRVITTYSSEEGLRDRNIYPVYQDRAGAIWLGAWPSTVSA